MRRWTLCATALIGALGLSACNTDSVMTPAAQAPAQGAASALDEEPAPAGIAAGSAAAGSAAAAAAAATTPDGQPLVLATPVRVQLAPIVGATVETVTPLSRRMAVRANQRGISLVAAGEPDASHMMKGYFSAFTDQGDTTVIYVWDVLDEKGNRLHRIQGQEVAKGVVGEGWESVSSQTMETIADSTIDQLTVWLAARQS